MKPHRGKVCSRKTWSGEGQTPNRRVQRVEQTSYEAVLGKKRGTSSNVTQQLKDIAEELSEQQRVTLKMMLNTQLQAMKRQGKGNFLKFRAKVICTFSSTLYHGSGSTKGVKMYVFIVTSDYSTLCQNKFYLAMTWQLDPSIICSFVRPPGFSFLLKIFLKLQDLPKFSCSALHTP